MKNLRQIVLTFALLAVTTASAEGQQKLTREAYIQKYKPLAVEQMDIYGIPASIKLAQALFESDNGNSRLAREANIPLHRYRPSHSGGSVPGQMPA